MTGKIPNVNFTNKHAFYIDITNFNVVKCDKIYKLRTKYIAILKTLCHDLYDETPPKIKYEFYFSLKKNKL